jgi:hypothetical protein
MQFARKSLAVLTALILVSVLAFATAPTALTPVTLKQNNYAVQAGDLNLTPVAMDATNGNSFIATGKEVLLLVNTDTVTHTVTITSVADPLGRLGTITTYVVPAAVSGQSGLAAIEMTQIQGWAVGGVVNMTTSSALIFISVLRHQ